MSTFKVLLDTLAKSSSQAVATLDGGQTDEEQELKHFLYVKTDIEEDFSQLLERNSDSNAIIFLCGSSGDGKSEILKRYYSEYSEKYIFHLDATHSFRPDQSGIEAMDELLDSYKESNKPLIIGINVGMLFNYAKTGADRHTEIRKAMDDYLNHGQTSSNFIFLNFEDYPKFSLDDGDTGSSFIDSLLERVVTPSVENPLYRAYEQVQKPSTDSRIINYELLQQKFVRDRVIQLLLSARLRFDQFISARALLDFVHHLICGPGFIFDNLFIKGQNELSDRVNYFDPCSIRSKKVDQFLIQESLGIRDENLRNFQKDVLQTYKLENLTACSWLRFFFITEESTLGNNYHREFSESFRQPLYQKYISVWRLHAYFKGDSEERRRLREFYQEELISALMLYGNRLFPSLTKRQHMFLCKRNGVCISARAEIRPDFQRIKNASVKNIQEFPVCLKVGNTPIKIIQVNVSFLELIEKINNGYRPNKHDKNTIVLLEEIIEAITQVIVHSDILSFSSDKTRVSITNEIEDDEFVVGSEQ